MRSRGHVFSYITIFITEQWNLDIANVQGTDKSVRYKEVPLYRGSFPVQQQQQQQHLYFLH